MPDMHIEREKVSDNIIIQFLEDLRIDSSDLPEAIIGHWQEVIGMYGDATPNRDRAEILCKRMAIILRGLRKAGKDYRQIDKVQGWVAILLGAIRFDQQDWQGATYYFEQGARRLRQWDYKAFESLAYLGQTLTQKEQALTKRKSETWSQALESAQKALDSIRSLAIPNRTEQTKQLQNRIQQEINIISRESTRAEHIGSTKEDIAGEVKEISKPIRTMPIISNIVAGLDLLSENKIKGYIGLDEEYCNDADFGIEAVDNSLIEHGIFQGDVVLVRQQPEIEPGKIGVVVINTPEEEVGALKRFYRYDKQKSLRHWLLKSSNPDSEDLVVMPSGVDEDAILKLYATEVQSGRMRKRPRYFSNAELRIAGKYVGLVRSNFRL